MKFSVPDEKVSLDSVQLMTIAQLKGSFKQILIDILDADERILITKQVPQSAITNIKLSCSQVYHESTRVFAESVSKSNIKSL